MDTATIAAIVAALLALFGTAAAIVAAIVALLSFFGSCQIQKEGLTINSIL